MSKQPEDGQKGPLCPACKTQPGMTIAVTEEILNNGDVMKIIYCEDCLVVMNIQCVGRDPQQFKKFVDGIKASQIVAANQSLDVRNIRGDARKVLKDLERARGSSKFTKN